VDREFKVGSNGLAEGPGRKRKAMTLAETPVIDRGAILERVGGDEVLLREIITIFLDEYPALVADIGSSVERKDARALERSAHALKGSVSNFGARSATQAALDLEIMGRRNDLRRAAAVIETLKSELTSLHSALAHLRTN
jgi:HPt (histidine-containing phosphotransfer) domain-containing protein